MGRGPDSRKFAALVALVLTAGTAAGAGTEEVLARLQRAREEAGAPPLVRSEALDAVARERASRIAALPHARRLDSGGPLAEALARHDVDWYREAWYRLDLLSGYRDPGAAFADRWRQSARAWSRVLRPRPLSIGLAVVTAPDGWEVFVAVLLDPLERPDARDLERRTFEAINDVRAERGLARLLRDAALDEVARAHSEDMARHRYFDHEAPDGTNAGERAERRGLAYRRLAENIHTSRNSDDPVATAVASWMGSRSHRHTLLDPDFTHGGFGVAIGKDGDLYFTQLFAQGLRAGTETR